MKRMLLALLCTATLGGNAQTLLPAPQHLEYTSKKQFELHQGLQPQTMAGAPAPTLLLQEALRSEVSSKAGNTCLILPYPAAPNAEAMSETKSVIVRFAGLPTFSIRSVISL